MSDIGARFETLAALAGLAMPQLEWTLRNLLARTGDAIAAGDWGAACGTAASFEAGFECLEALARVRSGERPEAVLPVLFRADRTYRVARRDTFEFVAGAEALAAALSSYASPPAPQLCAPATWGGAVSDPGRQRRLLKGSDR